MSKCITRLAPSPTGALHIGNARTFLVNWLIARQRGWKILYRNEDLDGPRTKTGAAQQAEADLRWLGLDWDETSPDQSTRHDVYRQYLDKLIEKNLTYPCVCSRKDIARAASAPHREDGLIKYTETCLKNPPEDTSEAAWRLKTADIRVSFHDEICGDQNFDLADIGGDFVIFKSSQIAAYQLAVVVDDYESGVTEVVRGNDLLDSAARQLHLLDSLGISEKPGYYHLPLVVGEDLHRLAKRHGDTRLSYYRKKGCTPEKMLGLLASLCNTMDTPEPISIDELIKIFDISTMVAQDTIFTASDEKFLLE